MRRVPPSLVLAITAALVLGGCASRGDSRPAASGSPHAKASLTAAVKDPGRGCDGISYRDVRGKAPSYGLHTLRVYPARRWACRAFWLPHANQGFVPQSLALDGHTAWVSGYTWQPDVADRACRLMQVDLRTGKVLADQGRLVGAPGDREPTFCRHGGGLALDEHGLWVAEKERLWLVDPDRVGKRAGDAVIRVWGVRKPVYGSTLMIREVRLILGHYRAREHSALSRFRITDVLRPGVLDLVGRATGPDQVARSSRASMTGRAQGMTWRHGPVVTVSHRGCGVLVMPRGQRIGVIPGIEDVEFTGHNRLWVLSEDSAKVFQKDDRPVVPMLSTYVASKVLALRGPGDCFGAR